MKVVREVNYELENGMRSYVQLVHVGNGLKGIFVKYASVTPAVCYLACVTTL